MGIMNDRVKNQQKGHIGRAGGIVNIDDLITAHVNQSGQTMVKNTPQQPVSLDTGNKKKGGAT